MFCLHQDDLGLREDTYELCYNSACLLLGENDIEAAESKLKKAEGIENDISCTTLISYSFLSPF